MRRSSIIALAALLLGLVGLASGASATCIDSIPPFQPGGNVFGSNSAQWGAYFGGKVDANNGTACNLAVSGTFTINGSGLPTLAGTNVFTGLNTFTQTATFDFNVSSLPAAPTGTLVWGAGVDGVVARVLLDSFGAPSIWTGRRADGTNSAKTALVSGDEISSLNAWGFNGTAYVGPQAAIKTKAAGNWTTGPSYPTSIGFWTTPVSSGTLTEDWDIGPSGGLYGTGITGGDEGAGSINAGAYYLNGSPIASGTVTSVGLSLPSIFNITVSPVTGSGTLTATLATEAANTIFAGPTTGSAAAPMFRTLVGADLPTPGASSLGGVESAMAPSNQFGTGINTSGVPTFAQPTVGNLAAVAANSVLGNFTGSSAAPTATTVTGCPNSGTNHVVYISAGGFACGTTTLPTHTVLTSGTGTYTTPAGATWLEVTLVGDGGGGAGGNAAGNASAGTGTCINTTGAACTTPLYEAGPGSGGGTSAGGTGGTIAGSGTCDWSVPGGGGVGAEDSSATITGVSGGMGGSSTLGGAGITIRNGAAGTTPANSGAGGSGGGVSSAATVPGGSGGGAGATCHVIIASPAGSYTYAVGPGGAVAAPGTGGNAGAPGAQGQIIIYAHYGS